LRVFSFGGYGLALVALALVVFGAIECPPVGPSLYRLGKVGGYELWRLRLLSFGGYGLALAALALVVFGAYDSYPPSPTTALIQTCIA